jgi:hypothetical protein
MWALLNPGRGRKGKKRHRKGRVPEGLKGYQRFLKDYGAYDPVWRRQLWKQHKAEYMAGVYERKRIKRFKATRAGHFRGVPKRFVLRSDVPSIVGSAMRGAVCGGEEAVARAKARYCKPRAVAAPPPVETRGRGGVLEEWASAAKEFLPWGSSDNPRRHSKGGRWTMRKRRFNPGGMVSAATAGVRPSAIMGALPVAGGWLANTLLTAFVYDKLPAVAKKGAVKYLVGLGGAGLLAAAAKMLKPGISAGIFAGGMAGTLITMFTDMKAKGITGALSGDDFDSEGLPGWQGMGDFVTPPQIQAAVQMPSQIAQYPLPPPGQLQPGAEQAQYEANVLSEVMGDVGASLF